MERLLLQPDRLRPEQPAATAPGSKVSEVKAYSSSDYEGFSAFRGSISHCCCYDTCVAHFCVIDHLALAILSHLHCHHCYGYWCLCWHYNC